MLKNISEIPEFFAKKYWELVELEKILVFGFWLKALVVKNSVLHDFGFGKVSPAKQL